MQPMQIFDFNKPCGLHLYKIESVYQYDDLHHLYLYLKYCFIRKKFF